MAKKKTTKTTKKKVKKVKAEKKTYLSVSRLNLFEQCQQKYYYKYVLKLPDRSTYQSAAGSFLHKVLELFVLEYLKTSKLRDSASKAYAAAKKHPEIVELGELVTSEMCTDVKEMLKDYIRLLEKHPEKIPTFVQAETRFRFQIERTNFVVSGFIDRIDKVGKDKVEVVDYKTTSRPEYLTPFQLTVYSIPVLEMFPGKEIQASYELARHNFEKKSFLITDEDRSKAIQKFIDVGTQIENLLKKDDPKLWKPTPSYLCNYCPYRIKCAQDNSSSWSTTVDSDKKESIVTEPT